MNTVLLDRNLLALAHGSPETANAVTYAEDSPRIRFKTAKTGHTIPLYEQDEGNLKFLHSSFDPVREGLRLSEQHTGEGFLLVFGLGAGFHIRPLLKKSGITTVIIIENSVEKVRSILGHIDLSDIFFDKRISLWISENPADFSSYLLSKYIPVLSGNLQTLSLRSRILLDRPFYSELADVIQQTIGQITDDYTVQTHFGKKWFINTLSNLKESEKTTQTLFPVKTAYITAAGPSLERQLSFLKKQSNQGTVIATDTSLPVLLSQGLKPDLVISIDCQHISYNHFMSGYPEDVPLILDLASPSFLTRMAKKKFFFTSDHPLSRFVSREFRQFPKIDTSGGNVTHAALSLADILGASEIYLLGADFSYPSGKPYARNSYIYPYYFSRAFRTKGIEHSIFSFILHNKSIHKTKTAKGFRYISKPMIHYKASIEKRAAECRGRVIGVEGDGVPLHFPQDKGHVPQNSRIVSAGVPYISYREFLKAYRERIAALPEVDIPINAYLNSLSLEQKEAWITILPTAAQCRRKAESGEEAIREARQWSLDVLDRVIASEEQGSVIHKIG